MREKETETESKRASEEAKAMEKRSNAQKRCRKRMHINLGRIVVSFCICQLVIFIFIFFCYCFCRRSRSCWLVCLIFRIELTSIYFQWVDTFCSAKSTTKSYTLAWIYTVYNGLNEKKKLLKETINRFGNSA